MRPGRAGIHTRAVVASTRGRHGPRSRVRPIGHTGPMFLLTFSPEQPSEGPPVVVAVRGTHVYLDEGSDKMVDGALFIGVLRGRHCWAVDAESPAAQTGPD